jgi:hypothetical protein
MSQEQAAMLYSAVPHLPEMPERRTEFQKWRVNQ